MALALNLDPALMKKSDAEGPRLLFPESELSIRIGRAGLLSGKLPAADPGRSETGETQAWWREGWQGNARCCVLSSQSTHPTVARR